MGIFRTIAKWYLLFLAKFRGHRVKNEKVMKENVSQLNAPVLMAELLQRFFVDTHMKN